MARLDISGQLDVRIKFNVTEEEARALDALAGYGDDAFIKAFYEKLGTAYMAAHEKGLRSFLSSIRCSMHELLSRADKARASFDAK